MFFCLTLVFKPHDPIMWGCGGNLREHVEYFFLAKRLSRITGVLRGAAVGSSQGAGGGRLCHSHVY